MGLRGGCADAPVSTAKASHPDSPAAVTCASAAAATTAASADEREREREREGGGERDAASAAAAGAVRAAAVNSTAALLDYGRRPDDEMYQIKEGLKGLTLPRNLLRKYGAGNLAADDDDSPSSAQKMIDAALVQAAGHGDVEGVKAMLLQVGVRESVCVGERARARERENERES